jgi:hypothetical protein
MGTKFDMEAFEKETFEMQEAIVKLAKRKRPVGVAAVTHDERAHFAYPRAGLEELASNLRELVAETGVRLPQDIAAMEESLAIAAKLKPMLKLIKDELRFLEGEVEDTHDKHLSEAWKIFTSYYTALAAAVNGNGNLERKYEPLAELFRVTKRAAKPKQVENEDKEPTPDAVKAKEANG